MKKKLKFIGAKVESDAKTRRKMSTLNCYFIPRTVLCHISDAASLTAHPVNHRFMAILMTEINDAN
jgi:hypothetical protein